MPDATTEKASQPLAGVRYVPALDGLRFCAFLLVFVHHLPRAASPWLAAVQDIGWVGVHIFLVLSAYLLTAILRAELDARGRIAVAKFYVRRILRIWPLYFAVCAASFGMAVLQHGWNAPDAWRLAGLLLFVDNAVSGLLDFNPLPYVAHLWTLSLEEQFYILLPVLAWRWMRDARVLQQRLLTVWVIFVILRFISVLAGARHPFIWTALFSADSLLAGTALGAGLLDGLRQRAARQGALWRAGAIAAGVVLLGAGRGGPGIGINGPHQVVVYALVALGAAVLTLRVLDDPWLRVLGAKPVRYAGKISYGLYVFHLGGIEAGLRAGAWLMPTSWFTGAALSFVVTCALAAASYAWFETPFLRLKRRFETVKTRPI